MILLLNIAISISGHVKTRPISYLYYIYVKLPKVNGIKVFVYSKVSAPMTARSTFKSL